MGADIGTEEDVSRHVDPCGGFVARVLDESGDFECVRCSKKVTYLEGVWVNADGMIPPKAPVITPEIWKVSPTSCDDGANFAWLKATYQNSLEYALREGPVWIKAEQMTWEMVGCVCHHNPPKDAIVLPSAHTPFYIMSPSD